MKDLDIGSRRCTVLGKGNKHRTIYFGRHTAKALWNYLRECVREPEEPLFYSDRGSKAGDALTRSGLRFLIIRLGKAAKIEVTRCSPHTFRHSFAVQFLRAGGNAFSLKEIEAVAPEPPIKGEVKFDTNTSKRVLMNQRPNPNFKWKAAMAYSFRIGQQEHRY